MKTRLLAIAVVAVIIGLGACGGKNKKKSSVAKITNVVVEGVTYNVSSDGKSFTYLYTKTGEKMWEDGEDNGAPPPWPRNVQIDWVGKSIHPPVTEKQNFEAAPVIYTVTAEDGTENKFTVKAERTMEY